MSGMDTGFDPYGQPISLDAGVPQNVGDVTGLGEAGGGGGYFSTQELANAGVILSVAGVLNNAIGSFYAAKNERYQLKSQQLALEFQQTVSNMNARRFETEAQGTMLAGQRQVGQYTMRAGAQKAAGKASFAARGVEAGVGSTAEVMATAETVKQIDAMTINANTVYAAEAQRAQATQARIQAMAAGVSARNLGVTRGAIRPGLMAGTSLLSGAGQVASSWAVMKSRGLFGSDFVEA